MVSLPFFVPLMGAYVLDEVIDLGQSSPTKPPCNLHTGTEGKGKGKDSVLPSSKITLTPPPSQAVAEDPDVFT